MDVEELLEAARPRLDRVQPPELAAELERGALLVDIRPEANRAAEGEMPGARVIERTVLQDLGVHRATDLAGGYRGWRRWSAGGAR